MPFHNRTRGNLRVVFFFLGAFFLMPGASRGQGESLAVKPPSRSSWEGQAKYRTGEILVRFRPNTSSDRIASLHFAINARVMKSWASIPGLQLVRLPEGISAKDAIQAYRRSPEVLYAEPNYVLHAFTTPNDPKFPQLWGLQNTGQLTGTPGADIHASAAWAITTGSSNVVVAVIDTGLDYTHQDLAANAWSSSSPFSATIDGVPVNCAAGTHGFNAVSKSCDPMDDNGHGTHVSGTIGAVGNNGVGVTGVNWSVRIMACKFLDASGGGSVDGAVTCLDFVKAMKDSGVNVVATNNSWGGFGSSQALSDAIRAQQQSGILFVTSAGNDSADNDAQAPIPAGIFSPNLVSVAATTRFDWLAYFSDTGRHSVSLGAPGQEILSTFPRDSYFVLSGTSMAAPHVTGVAALLAAQDPARDWRAIRNLLLAGGDSIPTVAQTVSGKRLNALGSLTCSNSHIARRLQPTLDVIPGSVGTPIVLAAININCAQPAGPVTVTVSPGGQTISLLDNGSAPDQAAQDGIYAGQFTPPGPGNYQLSFSTGDSLQVTVLSNYAVEQTGFSYQTIGGTNLNLGDDEVATVNLPFPVQYGGGTFSRAYVSSNGTISFTNAFGDFLNFAIPINTFENGNPQNPPPPELLQPVVTLIAPYWMDLYPVKGTAQNVFWAITGTAPNRQVIIEWRNVRSFLCRTDSTANVTFEAVFSESTSNVLFNYANPNFGDACTPQNYGLAASIGLQVSQDLGTQWGDNQTSIASGIALLWTPQPANPGPSPLPTATSVSPSSVAAGSGDTWVTVTGTGFVPETRESFYAVFSHATKYISSTQMQVLLRASELAFPANIQLNIFNPPPGGGVSEAVFVSVVGQTPVITSLTPSGIPAGSFGFNLVVNGSGFVPFSTDISFNGTGGLTTFVSPTQVIFSVPGALVQSAGPVTVQAQTGPNTFSNTLTFTVTSASSPATLSAPAVSSTAKGAPVRPELFPGRFLGHNAAKWFGPRYEARYQRPQARLAPSVLIPQHFLSHTAVNPAAALAPALASFNIRPTLPAGFIPTCVATGDFNGDGKLDWAVANGGDNTIWIYLGNGDGTAKLPAITRLGGASPVAVAVADMNGDGKLDLVVAEADTLSVAVLLGNGDGTFGAELTFATPSFPVSVAVADFNTDGKLDVIVGMASTADTGQLAFLPGDGTGRLGQPVVHYGQINDAAFTTFSIAVADLNGDGLPDVVALDFSFSADGLLISEQRDNAGARVYLNQGNGTFKMAQQFFHDQSVDQVPSGAGQAATAVALGDLNHDGCVDAVTVDSEGTATFFPGLCDGTFDTLHTHIFGTGLFAGATALADVNGDGNLDLVSSAVPFLEDALFPSTPSNVISVQLGDGAGNFASPLLFRGESAMVSLAVADLRKNGRPEIIAVNQNEDTISVFHNDGSGGFGAPRGGYLGYLASGQMHAVGNAPFTNFAVADLNGDGRPDLASLEVGSQFPLPVQVAVLANNGDGTFAPPVRSPILDVNYDLRDFFLADFRNTGKKDLLFFAFYLPIPGPGLSYGFARANGDGTFQKPVLTNVAASGVFPLNGAVGDFNGDGKLDFLMVSFATAPGGNGSVASLIPFLGNGDGTFTQATPVSFPSSPSRGPFFSSATVTDLNGDGKPDLVVFGGQVFSTNENNAIYLLLGNGDGTFQVPRLLINNVGPFAVADLNNDGHPDIVVAIDRGLDPAIFGHLWVYQAFLQNVDGSFTSGPQYGPFPNPYAAGYLYPSADHPLGHSGPVVGDFNGDGIPDLAVYETDATNVFNSIGFAGAPLNVTVSILPGNGDGTFAVPNFSPGLGGIVVPQAASDLNGDGRTDLIEMNAYTSSFTTLSATGGPSFGLGLVSDPVIGTTGTLRVFRTFTSSSATTLQLSSSDPSIVVPANLTIPAGSGFQDVSFQIAAGFNPNHIFALTAQLGTEAHSAYGTQAAPGQNAGFAASYALGITPVILAGQSTPDYGLFVSSIGGYATQLTITCSALPSGASCKISPDPATLPAGGQAAISVSVATQSGVAPGQYHFQITVADGVSTLALPAAFNIGDFALSLTPPAQTLGPTDFTSFTLNIDGINGYSQPIQVTCSGLPGGTVCPFNSPVFPGPNFFQIHTQNAAPGPYTLTFTGTSNGISRMATAQLTVSSGSFSGSVSPTTATIPVKGSKSFTVSLNSSGGFQGQVNLTCNAISQISCQLTPSQVTLATGGSASASLSISVTSNPAGLPDCPRGGPSIRYRLQPLVWLVLIALVTVWIHLATRAPRKLIWRSQQAFLLLIFLALAISSCGGGGGGTVGGGGGSGGGGFTATSVTVQGTAGGTTTVLGTVSVTIPK